MDAKQVRREFWREYFVGGKPREYYGKSQNDLPADVRAQFVDFVDQLRRNENITDRVASTVTL
jgi:hypothetical protein